MKVCLIQPPSSFLIDQGVHPPLGLWYLGAALKQAGYEVVYCDLGLGDVIPEDADVYGITGTTPQLGAMLHIIADLYAGGKRVVVGGPHATVEPNVFLDVGAHVVVQGEGEKVLVDLLADWPPEPIVRQAPRIRDLDSLPLADREQVARYHYTIGDRHNQPVAATTLISSRGCPHRCQFCSHAIWKQEYRCRSADNVLQEVAMLHSQYGYSAVHFFDDSLAVNRSRLLQICTGLKQLPVEWRCFVRADAVDIGLLQHMAEAGCVELGIGVESGSPKVLTAIQKGETVEQQRLAILNARQVGLRVKGFFIVGLPGEDWTTVDETVRFIEQTHPDDIDVSILSILPGSGIYTAPAQFGVKITTGPTFYKGTPGMYTAGHRTTALSSDDLIAARNYIEARCKPRRIS